MPNSSGYQGQGRPQQGGYRQPQPQRQSRSGYVYRERPAEALNERAERTGGRFDSIFKGGFPAFKPKQGTNLIRYLPPTWDDATHWAKNVFVHSYIGPDTGSYLCLLRHFDQPCPICKAAKEARNAGDEELAKQLNVGEKVVSWIIDRDGEDKTKPLLFLQSWTQDRDIAAICRDPITHVPIWIDRPDDGFDLAFQRNGTGLRTKYVAYQIMREPTPIAADMRVQDQIMEYIMNNPIPSVLQFYPAEYLERALLGTTQGVSDDRAGAAILMPSPLNPREAYEEGVQYSDEPFDASGPLPAEAPWEPIDEPGQQEEAWQEPGPAAQEAPHFSQRAPGQPPTQERATMARPQQAPPPRATMQPQQPQRRATMQPPPPRMPSPR